MKHLTILFLILICFTATSQSGEPLVVRNITLIDGNGGPAIENQTIVSIDGRITEIGNDGDINAPRKSQIVDGKGKFLLPGFIDSNVHASLYGGSSRPETIVKYGERNTELIAEFVQLELKHGVTTIRDSFGALLPLMEVRDKIAKGEFIGPRMLVAGNIVGWGGPFSVSWGLTRESEITAFQEHWNDFITQGSGEAMLDMTPGELRIAINKYLDLGPDFIKYGGTSHFANPEMITFSPRTQKVLVDETHKRGLVAETHSTNLEGLLLSIEAGIDLIQHPEHSSRELTDEIINEILERGVIGAMLSNTLTGDVWQQHLVKKTAAIAAAKKKDEGFPKDRKKSTAEQRRELQQQELWMDIARINAEKMIKAGCILTIGTDNYHGAAPELQRRPKPENQEPGIGSIIAIEGLVELGMTPAQAIMSATKHGAMAARKLEEIGTVEVGKIADMIILEEDPLKEISNIRTLSTVIQNGKIVDLTNLPEQPVFRKK